MSDTELRDTKTQSRKGRKPKGDVAMTSAERKRSQRKREREKEATIPQWLRIRRQLWDVVQREFIFTNADQLSCALKSLAMAITVSNCYRTVPDQQFLYLWKAYAKTAELSDSETTAIALHFYELLPYEWHGEKLFPSAKDAILLDLIRDLIDGHEIEGGAEDE